MASAELRLLDALAYLEGCMGCLGLVLLMLVGSPYGRYSADWPGLRVPARPAWLLQELPSLAWPLYECVRPAAARLGSWPNRVLLAMFLLHYVQRTLVFSTLIRGGKPTPLFSCALAFLFCAVNGYMQSRYLSQFAVYAEDWVTHPCFLTGFVLWLMGMVINIHSDSILRNLRRPGRLDTEYPGEACLNMCLQPTILGKSWSGVALHWLAGPSKAGCSLCSRFAFSSAEPDSITSGTMRNLKITQSPEKLYFRFCFNALSMKLSSVGTFLVIPSGKYKFSKLLLHLLALRSIGLKCLEHLLFFKVICDTPIDTFLMEMLEAPHQLA